MTARLSGRQSYTNDIQKHTVNTNVFRASILWFRYMVFNATYNNYFCDFTTVYTTILKIKRQIKRISSTVFNKIELSTQIQILCCREASQPRFVNSSYIIGRAMNCLPFRSSWVHLQFLVGIVLLDLLFGVYVL
jgi:hypothetical protein